MTAWFQEFPERYEKELRLLREAGFEFEVDQPELEAGSLILYVQYPDGERSHLLTVTFPAEYPYFPFGITAPTFPSGRHLHPYGNDLCLLADLQNAWISSEDTLAGFLQEKVPAILETHLDDERGPELEGHEALRSSWYLDYPSGTKVLVGAWEIPPDIDRGTLTIALDPGFDPNGRLRGAVTEVFDSNGARIAELDAGNWSELYSRPSTKKLRARWVRLPTPPKKVGTAILDEAKAIWPSLATPKYKGGPDVVGLLFPEERDYRGDWMDTWAFAVRKKVAHQGRAGISHSPAWAEVLSRDALQARVPRVSPLAGKRVLVAGLGALGAPLALQLGRAGLGQLVCVDRDFVQVGNLVRWIGGIELVGLPKSEAVARLLRAQFPYLGVRVGHFSIGAIGINSKQLLEQLLEDVDLIVDTTAEWAVNHYLSDVARSRGLPYVWATATPGGWGGTVGRVAPGHTPGCWNCFQRHMYDDRIKRPPQEKGADVQPPGCFHPTFTGTGFDMDHVSLMATRLVASTLCADAAGGYPDFDWNAAVLSLWDELSGAPIAPTWKTIRLERHPDCPHHE
ncbi:ThiF family adenylyltransferase [Thioalkalivibrio sp. ALE31]|uniref:HesA/MoeB/ThiF family protein n=1 Tax=Thioalkalivibrio sp. ALE31 TaxID=1158182 RepID=UPI00035E6EB0|nr:ThiF family adenylyltransferase [Thioalkalivibrio sp. ALE31]